MTRSLHTLLTAGPEGTCDGKGNCIPAPKCPPSCGPHPSKPPVHSTTPARVQMGRMSARYAVAFSPALCCVVYFPASPAASDCLLAFQNCHALSCKLPHAFLQGFVSSPASRHAFCCKLLHAFLQAAAQFPSKLLHPYQDAFSFGFCAVSLALPLASSSFYSTICRPVQGVRVQLFDRKVHQRAQQVSTIN